MKLPKTLFIFQAAAIMLFFMVEPGFSQPLDNLYNLLRKQAPVKVSIGQFSNRTEAPLLNRSEIAEYLKEALSERKTIKFQTVPEGRDAKISISGKFLKYDYQASDPVDNITGSIAIFVDAMVTQNYATAEVEFEVTDTKTKKVLWREPVRATVTKSNMSEEASIPLVCQRAVKLFIIKCFGRPK